MALGNIRSFNENAFFWLSLTFPTSGIEDHYNELLVSQHLQKAGMEMETCSSGLPGTGLCSCSLENSWPI